MIPGHVAYAGESVAESLWRLHKGDLAACLLGLEARLLLGARPDLVRVALGRLDEVASVPALGRLDELVSTPRTVYH